MKSILLCTAFGLLLQASDCGDAGVRVEDQRKAARPVPQAGDEVMTKDRNEVGVIQLRHGVPYIVYADGAERNAAEVELVAMPKLPKRPGNAPEVAGQ